MKRHGQKSRSGNFSMALLAIFLLFCIGYLAITDIRLQKRKNALEYQFNDILKKKQELEADYKDLKAQVAQIGDKNYQEEILREKGMYKKAGEGTIVVKDLEKQNKTGQSQEKSGNISFLEKVFESLKKLFKK